MDKRKLIVPLAVLVLALGACGGDSEETGGETDSGNAADALPVTVTAADFAFDPEELAGHADHAIEITLVNEDDAAHTFTIDDLDVDLEVPGGSEDATTFPTDEAGTFEFYCKFHPDTMKGELTVE